MDCDIAIIGYGPVGATAAALLGGQGLKVAVVERMAGVYDKPRAITADHEVMRCMQFAGIGRELGAHVRPHPGTRYLGVDGNTIKQTDVIPPPYPLGWPTGIHFIQPEFEAMLRNAVARHGNIEVLLSHDLVDLADMGDGITLTVKDLAEAQTARSMRDIFWPATAPTASCAGSSGSASRISPSTSGGSSWMRGNGGPRRCRR